MFTNYLKLAWRNLKKNKVFSLINIISLSIGLSASFVIGMMVYYDFTFDTFHEDGDRIYRVVSDFKSPKTTFYNSGVPVPLVKEAKAMTSIETATYIHQWYVSRTEAVENDRIFRNLDKLIMTDKEYFEVFNYTWLAGSPESAFDGPYKTVLTEERAKEYFPDIEPLKTVGKEIKYGENTVATISGIVQKLPGRTDLFFNEFVSMATASRLEAKDDIMLGSWDNTNSATQLFVKVREGADIISINDQLLSIASKNEDKEFVEKYNQHTTFSLQPLSDLHFNGAYGIYDYSHVQADKGVLLNLGLLALFLLLLGSINFINLNTAQATQRSLEIGIRKTLGGSRSQMILQFLGETFLLTFIAMLISIVLTIGALRVFKDFVPSDLTIDIMLSPIIVSFMLLLLVIVTLLSGFYPGLVLSKFKPARVLKGDSTGVSNKSRLRKVLTVSQFVIAQVFIIATLVVGKQIHFMMNKDLGFKQDAIAYIQTPWDDTTVDSRELLANDLKKTPFIKEVSLGARPPASQGYSTGKVEMKVKDEVLKIDLQYLYGDTNYIDLYDIKVIAGRKPLNDTIAEYVINESAVKALGYNDPKTIIGKQITLSEGSSIPIVGVIKNFNQNSLHGSVRPLAITGDLYREHRTQFNIVHISLNGEQSNQWKNSLAQVETTFKSVYPNAIFKVNFVDETVARFYNKERRMSKLLKWTTGLAILISCLGLLGLVIHTTERRTKEVGIRKVLGASLSQLNILLCKEFLILVAIAFVIAVPLAYLGLNSWLQDFAYRTEMSWWIYALSGLAMVCVALLIMSIRTMATAMKNPVHSLKTE